MSERKFINTVILLLLLSLGLNAGMIVAASNLWFKLAEAEGHYVEARDFDRQLPDPTVYQIHKTKEGEAHIYCLNGTDATIRPAGTFGEMVVSCGTRGVNQ